MSLHNPYIVPFEKENKPTFVDPHVLVAVDKHTHPAVDGDATLSSKQGIIKMLYICLQYFNLKHRCIFTH